MNVRNVTVAAAFAVVAWAGTSWMLELPPFEATETQELPVLDEDDENVFPEKAPFRFSSRTLARICDEYSLDEESILNKMKSLGVDAKPEWSIKLIAEENDMEIQAVFDVIQQLAKD